MQFAIVAFLSVVASPWATAAAPKAPLVCGTDSSVSAPITPLADYDGVTRLLYLNRCVGGCQVTAGDDSSQDDSSTIPASNSTLAAFPYGDEVWNDVVDCMREMYAPFNINVTDTDPGELAHYETMIAGKDSDLGKAGLAGIAPFACGGSKNSISFAFAENIGGDARALCEVAAHESGHTFGLEHEYLSADPMTYLDHSGPRSFQDVDAGCGGFTMEACTCGASQNSVEHLLSVFGSGMLPATADLELVSLVEAPGASNGDGVIAPGEAVLIEMLLTNAGNSPTSGGSIEVTGPGFDGAREPALPEVSAGYTVSHTVTADVGGKACGELVDLEISTSVGGQSSSASTSFYVGIEQSLVAEEFATAAGWTTNAGQEGAATQGEWEFGVPARTAIVNQELQPNGGPAGLTDSVWMTGLGEAWEGDQVSGETVLTSTVIDLSAWQAVTGIRYNLWYVAFDRPNAMLVPSVTPHLSVELSGDDGVTWQVVDTVMIDPVRWEEREVSFTGFVPTSTVRMRFTADNDAPANERLVEVGIDSATLVGGSLLCEPVSDSGGGCTVGSEGDSKGGALALILVVAIAVGRRRRRVAQDRRPRKSS